MNDRQTDFLATIGAVYSDGVTLIFDGQTTATAKRYKSNKAVTFTAGQRVKVVKIAGTYLVEYPVAAQSGSTTPPSGGGGSGGDIDLMGDAAGFVIVTVTDLEAGTVSHTVSEILELANLGRGIMFRWPLAEPGSFMDYYFYRATSERIEFRSQLDRAENGDLEVGVIAVYDGNHFFMDQIFIDQETEVELVYDWDGECSLTTEEIYEKSTMAKTVIFRDTGDFEHEETASYALWHSDAGSAEFRSPVLISETGEATVNVVRVSEPNIITREVQTITGGGGSGSESGKNVDVLDTLPEAAESLRGRLAIVPSGDTDELYICMKVGGVIGWLKFEPSGSNTGNNTTSELGVAILGTMVLGG